MVRLSVLVVVALVAAAAIPLVVAVRTPSQTQRIFTSFMMEHGKKYESASEMFERFAIFSANLADIEAHNARPGITFTKGINQFSDLRADEMAKHMNLRRSGLVGNPLLTTLPVVTPTLPRVTVDSFDWRDQKLVTPVGDEGQCGSTWAWAPVTALETTWGKSSGTLTELSVQQVSNCDATSYGCNGGDPNGAFSYAILKGLCTATDYPYKPVDEQCRDSTCTPVAHWTAVAKMPLNETSLLSGVLAGPLSVVVVGACTSFNQYRSGIVDDPTCGTQVDHACTIVGFGTENGVDYWSLKNMWGTSWGENGYIRIVRNKNQFGIIAVADWPPTFPIV